MHPGGGPMHPGCGPMHPGCGPMHPGCGPMYPGCRACSRRDRPAGARSSPGSSPVRGPAPSRPTPGAHLHGHPPHHAGAVWCCVVHVPTVCMCCTCTLHMHTLRQCAMRRRAGATHAPLPRGVGAGRRREHILRAVRAAHQQPQLVPAGDPAPVPAPRPPRHERTRRRALTERGHLGRPKEWNRRFGAGTLPSPEGSPAQAGPPERWVAARAAASTGTLTTPGHLPAQWRVPPREPRAADVRLAAAAHSGVAAAPRRVHGRAGGGGHLGLPQERWPEAQPLQHDRLAPPRAVKGPAELAASGVQRLGERWVVPPAARVLEAARVDRRCRPHLGMRVGLGRLAHILAVARRAHLAGLRVLHLFPLVHLGRALEPHRTGRLDAVVRVPNPALRPLELTRDMRDTCPGGVLAPRLDQPARRRDG